MGVNKMRRKNNNELGFTGMGWRDKIGGVGEWGSRKKIIKKKQNQIVKNKK